MKKIIIIYFLFLVKLGLSQESKVYFKDFKLIADMMDSVKHLHYAKYKMTSMERIETGYESSTTKVKLKTHPRKLYLINPSKKLEILFNAEKNPTKCFIKPHVFPYFTMMLDPKGNLMRKNQHFTINEVGFDFIVKTIAIALSKEKGEIAKHLSLVGKAEKNGMTCSLIMYENKSFSYFDHVVKHKETVAVIAAHYIVNEYMVRTKNKLFDDYGYLKPGTIVKVPSHYCKKGIFYIDEKTKLPVSVSIFDEHGIFENYEFSDIEVNVKIPAAEFEKQFKGYGF